MRSIIGVTLLRSVGYTVALLVLFYAAPLAGRTSDSDVFLLVVGLLGFGMLMWRGVRAVMTSPTPRARAVQVIAAAVPLFVVVFAAAYYLMAEQSAHSFSASLNRTDSLYFTMTVFSTVGFGDITAVSQAARIMVMIQMIGDLAIFGAGVKLLTSAVRLGVQHRDQEAARQPDATDREQN